MSETLVTIEVDGRPLQARKGQMLIEVTDANRIHVPRFCYHRKLSVAANCRMCLVEVEKAPKPLPACATPVADGMKVFTRSPYALRAQKAVMEFLLINHPLDCPICDQGGECELQDLSMGYGRDVSRFQERKRVVKDADLGPLIQTDLTRCIQCTRCVRFGEEIAGIQELGMVGRGEREEIRTFMQRSVDSELSGNVIDLCPVGALTSKPFRFRARAWEMQQRATVAPHDAVGAGVHVHIARRRVMRVVPRENEVVNEVWLADRDRFSYSGLYSDDRLQQPMIKRDGEWQSVDWEDALDYLVTGLRAVIAEHGPDRVGALASPTATLEEHFLLQKLMRGIGSPHVDHRLRQLDFSDQDQLPAFPWLGQPIAELEQADAVLLVGSWARKEQPLVNHRLRKAALRGAHILVVNPLDYEFNYRPSGKIVTHPARMVDALARIARALGGGENDGFGALLAELAVRPEHEHFARQLAAAQRPTVLLGASALAHPQAALLRALAGCIAERSAASLGYLSDGPNGAGAWLAGMVPHRGPAGALAASAGMPVPEMLEAALPAYVLLGVEPELDCADGHAARAALERAAFVVALTAYNTPAMQAYADVLLPIVQFAENEGTYVNLEGRWQSFASVAPSPGQARLGWRILRVLGNRFELEGFDYRQVEQVREEVRGGVADSRAENRGAWVIPEALPHAAENGRQGALYRIGDVPLYAVDALVRRSLPLQQTRDAVPAGVYLNADTAERLGVQAGDRLTVAQGSGSVTLAVRLDPRVPDACARIPAALPETAALGPCFGAVEVRKA